MTVYDAYGSQHIRRPSDVGPTGRLAHPTIGTDFALGVCFAVLCEADDVATVKDANGDTLTTVALQKGYNPLRLMQIVATTALSGAQITLLY